MGPKKKKKAAVPPGIVRGYATTSIQKPKPQVFEPEPDAKPAESSSLPSTPTEATKPLDSWETTPQLTITPDSTLSKEAEHTTASRLATLKVEAELEKDERRRNVLAKDPTMPMLRLSDAAERHMFNCLKDEGFVDGFDWFAAERTEPTALVRLHTTYITLEKLGFSQRHIEDGMEAVGGQNVAGVLDWLCLTLPAEELPSGFSDKLDYDKENNIKVVPYVESSILEPRQRQTDIGLPSSVDKLLLRPAPEHSKPPASAPDQDIKNWILNATWDDSGSDTEAAPIVNETASERYARLQLELNNLKEQASHIKSSGGDGSKQKDVSIRIRDIVQSLKEVETEKGFNADLAMSLIAEGESRRQKEKQEEAASMVEDKSTASPQPAPTDDDEEDSSDLLNSIFEDSTPSSPPRSTQTPPTRILSLPITNWTGKTPKQLLQEWISRNARGATMKYYRIEDAATGIRAGVRFTGGNGKVEVNGQQVEMDVGERVEKGREAEEFVATKALYTFAANLPLHRSLPPAFRDLWMEWVDRENTAAKEEILAEEAERIRFLETLAVKRDERIKQYKGTENEQDQSPLSAVLPAIAPKAQDIKNTLPTHNPEQLHKEMERRKRMGPYRQLLNQRCNLPVYAMREEIVDTIRQHRVVVISGETGSGKSTQIPQFIIEDAVARGEAVCRVVCTQPRRISAISISSRVSEELGDAPGSVGADQSWVGYQVRLENRVGKETRLIFCTIGILLKRLESDYELRDVTHVVVDEVHERSLDSDFLVLCLKRLLEKRADLRILLMSATADANRFATYFERIHGVGTVPCLFVPGRTFPVRTMFLEDAIEETAFVAEGDSRKNMRDAGVVKISGARGKMQTMRIQYNEEDVKGRVQPEGRNEEEESDDEDEEEEREGEKGDASLSREFASQSTQSRTYSSSTLQSLSRLNPRKINFDLLDTLIRHVAKEAAEEMDEERGSILVFLPGIAEIKIMLDRLGGTKRLWLLGLHSSLGSADQTRVFKRPPPGHIKIVLSTNIAETGITIPDVTVVIDTMRAREIQFDRKRNITRLAEVLISRANALQRRGRAGRVREGVCWHLVGREQWDRLADHRQPEMVRVPLEEVCLRVRACRFEGSVASVLGGCVDAPPEKNVEKAVEALKMIEAFTPTEQLTALGLKLSHLPLDTRLGKMLLTSVALQCLGPILTICSVLSVGKSIFLSGGETERWREFVWGLSDLMMCAKAYEGFRAVSGGIRMKRAWCDKRDVSMEVLIAVDETRGQLVKALVESEVIKVNDSDKKTDIPDSYNVNGGNEDIVAMAIGNGAWPNIFVMDPPSTIDKQDKSPVIVHPPGQALLYRLHKISPLVKALGPEGVKEKGKGKWLAAYGVRGGEAGREFSCWDLTRVPGSGIWCLSGAGVDAQHRHRTLQFRNPSATQTQALTTRCPPRTACAIAYFGRKVRDVVARRMVGMEEEAQHDEKIIDVLRKVIGVEGQ